MKKQVLTLVANAAMKAARKSTNSASLYCAYQPKEPKALRK